MSKAETTVEIFAREVFENVEWELQYKCRNLQGTVRPSVYHVADQEDLDLLRRNEVGKGSVSESFPLLTIVASPDRELDALRMEPENAMLQGTKEHAQHRDLRHEIG